MTHPTPSLIQIFIGQDIISAHECHIFLYHLISLCWLWITHPNAWRYWRPQVLCFAFSALSWPFPGMGDLGFLQCIRSISWLRPSMVVPYFWRITEIWWWMVWRSMQKIYMSKTWMHILIDSKLLGRDHHVKFQSIWGNPWPNIRISPKKLKRHIQLLTIIRPEPETSTTSLPQLAVAAVGKSRILLRGAAGGAKSSE